MPRVPVPAVPLNDALLAVVRGLSFARDGTSALDGLRDADWRRLLPLTDRSHLTLPLGIRALHGLPDWVRERIQRDLANNEIRHARTIEAHQEITAVFSARAIDSVVLKGLSQFPFYCDDPSHRPRYDIDLYCPPRCIDAAYQALIELGYVPFGEKGKTATDHLPAMIRKTGWRWRGDYYDPDMPLTIELHFRFWDAGWERFEVHESGDFWERRMDRRIAGLTIHALDPVDGLSYSAWHLVRHLLRGDLRAYHVYELAHFLHRTAALDDFWRDWRDARPSPLVESVAFRLAQDWFECTVNPVVAELTHALPPAIQRWFDIFSFSPLGALTRPNKDELFLHICMVPGWWDRVNVVQRRLLPVRFSHIVVDAHVPSPALSLRLKRKVAGTWFSVKRACYHARTLLSVLWNGIRWRRALAK